MDGGYYSILKDTDVPIFSCDIKIIYISHVCFQEKEIFSLHVFPERQINVTSMLSCYLTDMVCVKKLEQSLYL